MTQNSRTGPPEEAVFGFSYWSKICRKEVWFPEMEGKSFSHMCYWLELSEVTLRPGLVEIWSPDQMVLGLRVVSLIYVWMCVLNFKVCYCYHRQSGFSSKPIPFAARSGSSPRFRSVFSLDHFRWWGPWSCSQSSDAEVEGLIWSIWWQIVISAFQTPLWVTG